MPTKKKRSDAPASAPVVTSEESGASTRKKAKGRWEKAKGGASVSRFVAVDWDSPAGRLVGARIQHWWDGEESWFTGRIHKYDASTGRHLVKFDVDGEEEWIEIERECILFCDQVVVFPADFIARNPLGPSCSFYTSSLSPPLVHLF